MKKVTFISGFTGVGKTTFINSIKRHYDLMLPSPTKRILDLDAMSGCPDYFTDPHGLTMWFAQQYHIDELAKLFDLKDKNILIERTPFDQLAISRFSHYVKSDFDERNATMELIWKAFLNSVGPHEVDVILLTTTEDRTEILANDDARWRRHILSMNNYQGLSNIFNEEMRYWCNRLGITLREIPCLA